MKDKSIFSKINMRYFNKISHGGSNEIQTTNTPIWSQVIESILIVLIFSMVMQFLEFNFKELKKYQHMAVDIYPLTYNKAQVFLQDPSSCFPILEHSKNERNGAEYSYSCFINIGSDYVNTCKVDGGPTFQHIFHKGSPTIYPLMAPGVFIKSNDNVLRVYHNSTTKWNNFIDIANIPVNKWVHLVIILRGNFLEVYINANLAARMKFDGVPKPNFSNLYLLNDTVSQNNSTDKDVSQVFASVSAMKGYVSRLKYFAFALHFQQIEKLLREGPNKIVFENKGQKMDEYANLTDDWYTSNDHHGLGPQ